MRTRFSLIAGLSVALLVAACSGSPTTAPTLAATTTPATLAPATVAPTTAVTEAPATTAAVTVESKAVGSAGTILVAGSNGKTLYKFSHDVKDSGTSACTGACISTWPALAVAAGETPTGGAGVTGTLATITRDDGTLQVTYNGLPLYFFKNDAAPGDLNGVYANWETVKP